MGMSSTPPSQTKDFFPSPSPALSLTLAGIFRGGTAAAEERDDGGGGRRDETTVEISSENSGPLRSRSEDDFDHDEQHEDHEEDDNGDRKKKRKKYHRHTAEQIHEMEALFKESPHPDEKQRQQLSQQLGLHPRQVKFWFQNRRTQIKAIQERHENTLLKTELEKLRDENKALREANNQRGSCPNCGFGASSSSSKDGAQVRIENARLKSEVENLRKAIQQYIPHGVSPPLSNPSSAAESRSCLDFYSGMYSLDKSRTMEMVHQALEELKKMATSKEPLWFRSLETGREILNYDEYQKLFPANSSGNAPKIEASRETGVAFTDLSHLVQSFMDVNQWREMFAGMVSKAATVDVICMGEGANKDGAVQLMFAELQMLTPMVPSREVYFVRYSKRISADQWAIVDVSIDNVEDSIDASLAKCRKRASGCIIEDQSNGHCKVTWVEHIESQKTAVHSLFRAFVSSGLAFGASHWMAMLKLHCERLVFFMATNVPTKDSSGVATLAGRKSILQLAHRMTVSFCRALGASSCNTWTKVSSKCGDDIRVASRKNLNEPGEPLGVILCAVSSVWLPVSHHILFDFLRDETRRNEWDFMFNGGPIQSIVNLAKGKNRGNAVTIQTMETKDSSMWLLQDTSTNANESMVVYAPVDKNGMQSVMTGCDSSNIALLASGFSIVPDGVESRHLVITSKPEEKIAEAGSLLTIGFQILASNSQTANLSPESIESVNSLISRTLQKIKASLKCEDG